MDFNLDETQRELRELADDLLGKEAVQQRLEAHEKGGKPFDEGVWQAMRQAGLLGICLPEEAGGAGLGAVEMAVVLREVGAHVAPVPALHTLVAGLTIATHGSAEQKAGLREGEVLSFALREPGRAMSDPLTTVAVDSGEGWVLTGRKSGVSYPAKVLVPADQGLFLVDGPPTIPEFTSTGEPAGTLVLDRTPAERIGGQEAVDGLRRIATAAVAAQASGVLAGALKLTTDYIKTRRQFGRALAEFQAVTMQIADVYVTTRALDVAMWSGAWRLAEGLDADEDLAIAAFHVSEAATALYTCQHLHGGLGLDVTYPLHRYFAQAKHLTHLLGGADAQLDLIGALV